MLKKIFFELQLLFVSYSKELVIISGADSSHFKSLCQFTESALKQEPNSKIIIFDLGFEKSQIDFFSNKFPEVTLRTFDYSKYPSYFNIKINAGEYAWKPVLINDVLNEFKCNVCWMDSGNLIIKPLVTIRKIISIYGFYSTITKGKISDWTHIKTLELLNANNSELLKKKNISGACIAINYKNEEAKKLIQNWSKYAQIKEYIAPEGSNRTNHRQDQALLSVLLNKTMPKVAALMNKRKVGFKTHKDID